MLTLQQGTRGSVESEVRCALVTRWNIRVEAIASSLGRFRSSRGATRGATHEDSDRLSLSDTVPGENDTDEPRDSPSGCCGVAEELEIGFRERPLRDLRNDRIVILLC